MDFFRTEASGDFGGMRVTSRGLLAALFTSGSADVFVIGWYDSAGDVMRPENIDDATIARAISAKPNDFASALCLIIMFVPLFSFVAALICDS
jgi:hypothetical protein